MLAIGNDKTCSRCRQIKPLSEFYACRSRADGLHHTCRTCAKVSRKRKSYPVTVLEKKCSKCGEVKPRSEFWRNPARPDGLKVYCIPCTRAHDGWHQQSIAKKLEYRLRRFYGLTTAQFERMKKEQDCRCAVCHEPCDKLNVDHDHKTGKVRALLCHLCNSAIGGMQDDPQRLREAACYLERHTI